MDLQFGLDQLQDASTTEITAFIHWYVWTYVSSRAVFQLTRTCADNKSHFGINSCLHKPYISDQFIFHTRFTSSKGTSDTKSIQINLQSD